MAEDKARNTDSRYGEPTIGVCPDQWGVWSPEEEQQIPWETALDEMASAGFAVMKTGPFGYGPKNPKRRQQAMDQRGFRAIAETHAAVGAEYIVHLPPMVRDEKSWEDTDDRALSTQARNTPVSNADRLGRLLKQDYGLAMVLHAHGDSHLETPDDIDLAVRSGGRPGVLGRAAGRGPCHAADRGPRRPRQELYVV